MGDNDFDGGLFEVALFLIDKFVKPSFYISTFPRTGFDLDKAAQTIRYGESPKL